MTFESLEQRIAQSYLDLLAPFVPDDNASISVSEQEKFYHLIKNLYQLAFNEPLLFVSSLHEDDAYPGYIKSSYGKPELQVNMNKFSNTIDILLKNLFLIGQGLEVKLNRRQSNILLKLGINDITNLSPAWIWMSNRIDGGLTHFSFCLFNKNHPYTSDIYARLVGEAAFRKLESWMVTQGYKRFDIYDITGSNCKLSLTYANPIWSSEPPNGGFEYKIKHTGISVRYDACFKNPVIFGLCIPSSFKPFLEGFETADNSVKQFIVTHTKKCDGCRYCVQTDKTGARPLAAIEVSHGGEQHCLCPYFPGYGYRWSSINDTLVERLIEMLTFMDKFASRKR